MKPLQNVTHEIKYHFVFCTRYRRKVLLGDVEESFKKLLYDNICKEYGWEIIFLKVYPDYCHLYLKALPTDRPSDIMARIKSFTSRHLRSFEHLNHLESLWTRSYFVSTDPYVTSFEVDKFVNSQKTRG